ncbi:MAG: sulfite exporter TauE/SafE family protein [Gemmatimonadaceae bacterium]|nr:sulfite exporter TauE/SafE family protein [Gemmatimonadaceae bacterium]
MPLTALPLPSAARLAAVVLVSAVAGGVNAIAGGGTLLTFPALIGLGVPPIIANATSTVALWPGSAGSMWGYRNELAGARRWALWFAVPSVVGGAAGAWLLLRTPADRFAALVPWLVLGATAIFVLQAPLQRALRVRGATGPATADGDVAITTDRPGAGVLLAQLPVSVYGGYFGAGIGILMLAALGFMGLANIHRMNGLKAWGGLCINAMAAGIFIVGGLVSWHIALAMAAGSIAGGYGGARMAQRVPQAWVRWSVVAVGFSSGVWLYIAHRQSLL